MFVHDNSSPKIRLHFACAGIADLMLDLIVKNSIVYMLYGHCWCLSWLYFDV